MAKPAAEWICAAIAFAITGATFVIVARDLRSTPDPAPVIRLSVEYVTPQPDGFLVAIQAENISRSTAAAYRVEGTLLRDGAVVERSDVTFDYVPRGSTETGGLWFTQDPRDGEIQLRSLGYQEP
jgi:uncharacterized protein (TIGR02588 family)